MHPLGVPVDPLRSRIVERNHINVLLLDQVVVNDDHTVERPKETRQNVDCVVDRFRRIKEIPRKNHHGDHSSDQTTTTPGNHLREHVRDIKRCRNEVRHNVHPNRCHEERKAHQEHNERRIQVTHDVDRIDQHLAEHGRRTRNRDHCDRGEEHEVNRQAPEITALHIVDALAILREVTIVKRGTSKVGNDQRDPHNHLPERFTRGELFIVQSERDVAPTCLIDDVEHQDDHHHINGRTRPVDEALNEVHLHQEERRLEKPHNDKAPPTQGGKTKDAVFGIRR